MSGCGIDQWRRICEFAIMLIDSGRPHKARDLLTYAAVHNFSAVESMISDCIQQDARTALGGGDAA